MKITLVSRRVNARLISKPKLILAHAHSSKSLDTLLSSSKRHALWGIRSISGDVSLVSAGRIDKDTPPLTTPSHTSKSSAMDISSHIFGVVIHREVHGRFHPRPDSLSNMTRGQKAYLYSRNKREGKISPLSGTDSDLEAFSHYPADGSFAALPGRAAAKTNYLNQRFLSY